MARHPEPPASSVRRPVMRQRWEHLTFVHWPVEPTIVQSRLPAPLRVDTRRPRLGGPRPVPDGRYRPAPGPGRSLPGHLLGNQRADVRVRSHIRELDDGLVAAAGYRLDGPPASVLYSPGVEVTAGRPRVIAPADESA